MTNHNSFKTVLKLGVSLSVFFAVCAQATDVATWAEINAAASDDITVTADIQATGTPKTINLTTNNQVVDGNGHSLTGASQYKLSFSGSNQTVRNFGLAETVTSADDYTYSYLDSDGDTVYKKINASVNGFSAAPFVFSNNFTIDNTVFSDNTKLTFSSSPSGATPSYLTNSVFYGNTNLSGNVCYWGGSSVLNINGTIFDSNFGDDSIFELNARTTINNSIFQNNTVTYYGVFQLSGGEIDISNSQFINNRTDYDGAAISDTHAIKTIVNTVFDGNYAGNEGGAIWEPLQANSDISPYFSQVTFKNNQSGWLGGGMYLSGAGERSISSNIVNSLFEGNTSKFGGGLCVSNLVDLAVVDTNFSGNTAREGGAIYAADLNLNIFAETQDVVFSGNTATNTTDSYNGGAAVYFEYTGEDDDIALNVNAAKDKKVIFDDTLAAAGEPILNVNKSGLTYENLSGETVAITNAGEVQFNANVGDAENPFASVNVHNGTLSIGDNVSIYANLNAEGGTINISNATVNATSAHFAAGSTLALTVNSTEDYGSLTAGEITIESGAKLKATLAQGIVPSGGTATLQLLSAGNEDFNNFEDSFDNNMYHFEKADKNGKYTITSTNSGSDIAAGQGWVSSAAKAYVDGPSFKPGTVAADVANKLAALAQNDANAFVEQIKAIAPMETTIVQGQAVEDVNRLFKTVDSYLRGERDPMGVSAGDEDSDTALWIKPYVGKSKMGNRAGIAGFDTNSQGVIAGLERKFDSIWKLGAGLQYDETDVDTYGRDIDSKTKVGFVYGEYKPDKWFINSALSYASSNYDEDKYALGSKYAADYHVKTASVTAMTGYQFKYLTPEVGIRYYNIRQDAYTDSAMQKVSGIDTDIVRAVGGVHFVTNYGMFYPNIHAGLTYDINQAKHNTLVSLSNGTSYIVEGKELARLGYEFDMGVNAHISDNMIIGAGYTGAYRNNYQEHTGIIKLKYGF